jgi:hypothetical protein
MKPSLVLVVSTSHALLTPTQRRTVKKNKGQRTGNIRELLCQRTYYVSIYDLLMNLLNYLYNSLTYLIESLTICLLK